MGIIESNMAVLSEADESNVERRSGKRFTVGRAISSPGFSIQSLELWSFGVWDLEFFFVPFFSPFAP